MSSCLGCEQSAQQKMFEINRVKEQAAKYGEENQVDMAIYYTPEGWQYIDASKAAGLPVSGIVLYPRSATL